MIVGDKVFSPEAFMINFTIMNIPARHHMDGEALFAVFSNLGQGLDIIQFGASNFTHLSLSVII